MTATTTTHALDLAERPVLTPHGAVTSYPATVDPGAATVTTSDGTAHPSGALIPLPKIGEFVTLVDAAGTRLTGYWLGVGGTQGDPHLRARILTGETIQERLIDPSNAHAGSIVHGEADTDQRPVLRALADTLTARDAAHAAHETWKEQLNAAMWDAANEHDLCGQFDQFCDDNGLQGRRREFDLTVSVRLSFTVSREAVTAEAAIDDISRHDVIDALQTADFDYALDEWDATEA